MSKSTPSKEQSKVWILSSGKHPKDVVEAIRRGRDLPNYADLSVVYCDEQQEDDTFHYYLLFDNSAKRNKPSTFQMQIKQMKIFAESLGEQLNCSFKVAKSSRHTLNKIRKTMKPTIITLNYKENDNVTERGDDDVKSHYDDDDDDSTSVNSPKYKNLKDVINESNKTIVNPGGFAQPATKDNKSKFAGLKTEQFIKLICKGRIPYYALFKYAEKRNDWHAKKKLKDDSVKLLEFEALVLTCTDNTYLHVDPKDDLISELIEMASSTIEKPFSNVDDKADFDELGSDTDFVMISNLISNYFISYASLLKFFILEGQMEAKKFLGKHQENFLNAESSLKSVGNAKSFAKVYDRDLIVLAFKELKDAFDWGEAIWKAIEESGRVDEHDISGFEPDKKHLNTGAKM
jgi:hypothetical protein